MFVLESLSWRSPVSPLSPYRFKNTLASVPAPYTSPVNTFTVYETSENSNEEVSKLKYKNEANTFKKKQQTNKCHHLGDYNESLIDWIK